MRTWDEFLEWIDGFNKIDTHFVYDDQPDGDYIVAESVPIGVEGPDKEVVKNLLMESVTNLIGDADRCDVWVRVKSEVNEIIGAPSLSFQGYARIAVKGGKYA